MLRIVKVSLSAVRPAAGLGSVYRNFPTRPDLVVAVDGHQAEACTAAGPRLLAEAAPPFDALLAWVDRLVDFGITKHGLADALGSDDTGFGQLHAYFLDRPVPVRAELLDATERADRTTPGVDAYALMRGIGHLCVGHESDHRYDSRHMVGLLMSGLRATAAAPTANP